MSETTAADHVFRFGPFVLNVHRGTLAKDSASIFLRPKAYTLLVHLARNMGRVVPKAELMDAAWPGIYVTEDSLTQSIREIRKALTDQDADLIRTVSRRGYMLLDDPQPLLLDGSSERPVLAVLRFSDEHQSSDQEGRADRFVDDIINGLSRYRSVDVLARSSSLSLSSEARADWPLAASKLGADYIVAGAIRGGAEDTSIVVSLIDARKLTQIWGERYDLSNADLRAAQQDIAAQTISRLVTEVDDKALRQAEAKPIVSLGAHALFLRAAAILRDPEARRFEDARRLLEEAIKRDPDYAAAHSYLALSIAMIGGYGTASSEDLSKAQVIAARGISLGSDMSLTHRVMSALKLFSGQHAAAEQSLRTSLTLNPSDADSVGQMGHLLTLRGRPVEGLAWLDRAVKLNPIHPEWYYFSRSLALYQLAEYGEAAELLEAMPKTVPWVRSQLASCYALAGNMQRARDHFAAVRALSPTFDAVRHARLAYGLEHQSDVDHFVAGIDRAMAA